MPIDTTTATSAAQASSSRSRRRNHWPRRGAYLLIGVATDMRYHYWSLLAVLLATLAVAPRLGQWVRRRDRELLACAALVAVVVSIGIASRLLDFRGLM